MSQLSALIAGNTLGRPMNRGAQAISAGGSEATLVLNATSTSGEFQVQGEILMIDPGGSIDVLLPPEAASNGMVLLIHNTDGDSETITVKSSGDSTLGHGGNPAIAQDEGGIFFCDGTSWYGWVLKALT